MRLTELVETLDRQDVDHRDGVRFGKAEPGSSEITISYQRWMDMGKPGQILSRISVPGEPVCTCGPGKELVCHSWGSEPHYAGCPRWGTPLAS